MDTLDVTPRDARQLQTEALTWPEQARALAIRDAETYIAAGEMLKAIKALRDKIADHFDPHIHRAYETHRGLCADKKKADDPLVEADRVLRAGLIAYGEAQEQARRAEEARLAELARQAEERRRLEEAAALEREAARTGDAQLHAEAIAVLEDPAPLPAVVLPSTTPKVAGISKTSYTYTARVVRLEAFLAYVFAHPDPGRALIAPDQKALDRLADAQRERFRVPGVDLVKTPRLAVRR